MAYPPDPTEQRGAPSPHFSRDFGLLWELFDAAPAHYPQEREALTRIQEQYKHLENELDDMTGQFCNEAIHLTRAEDRVRELEEQHEALLAEWSDYRATTEDIITDLKEQFDALRLAVEAWDATLSSYCDGPERDAVRRTLSNPATIQDDPAGYRAP